jgi:hypothetical protein
LWCPSETQQWERWLTFAECEELQAASLQAGTGSIEQEIGLKGKNK